MNCPNCNEGLEEGFCSECGHDEDNEDWVKEIYKHYLDEFADENGDLEMYVW